MKRIMLSAFIVLALISIDATISMAYAKSNITIFKVTKVSTKNKLRLRAWPSPKSRVKVSLPHNAVDLLATGKKKNLGKSKWIEVKWQNNQGWVNARYLKKTGVLPISINKTPSAAVVAVTSGSRNIAKAVTNPVAKAKTKITTNRAREAKKNISNPTPNAMPQMPTENRYYQPTQLAAREVKTTYTPNAESSDKILRCIGSSPRPWSIKLNTANKRMQVNFKNGQSFNVPINYHEWASSNKVRMNIGGNKGRNIVDVNLEKTDACSTGLSRTNYMYEVNATINRDFFSGCCETISQ